ncbi:hypothetical protein LNQ49_07830 [Flavobacterium sp. F-65]|jgi:lipopolysaccharide assembly outer membrane protein LptD (OstA)|uniref:Lipocalin-like domain-containing protein n=1 Tax=Flavobacterium pisciphilum TaxID=2893755 RepID=A0ABS8MRU1_9FLAO|nr:hypothetical protein [Flavobacterium sp. F-65]MCC9071485.1 hypothetical protein [Flavobacterium sp. F-65]
MKKTILALLIIISVSTYSANVVLKYNKATKLYGSWTWQKSTGGQNGNYTSTPKSIGSTKKLVFTTEGKVITYKNNVEIRNSKYQITKGISVLDNQERDLITFEGITYIIEKLDSSSLVIVNNSVEGYTSTYKK